MNRFEIELKLRSGIINGRKWRCDRYGGANRLSISEVSLSLDAKSERHFPGRWTGQPHLGFRALELAGFDRRNAMSCPSYRQDKINQFKRRAREAIEHSRYMRLSAEPVAVQMARAA